MYLRKIWLYCLISLMFLTSPAVGQSIDRKLGELGHLSEYIGTYNYEAVLNDDAVSAKLVSILGSDLERFRRNLSTHGPIGFSGSCLILTGNAPHRGFVENAYLNVCLHDGNVDIVLTGDGSVQIYSERSQYHRLDWMLRSWIARFHSQDHFSTTYALTLHCS